jgi:hypothetical protein
MIERQLGSGGKVKTELSNTGEQLTDVMQLLLSHAVCKEAL